MIFHSTDLTIAQTTPSIHKDAELILERAHTVSQQLGIADDQGYRHHTTMTNYLYVDAPVDKMVNAVVTYDVLYYFDDVFGEDTAKGATPDFKHLMAVWSGRESPPEGEGSIAKLYRSVGHISSSIRNDCPEGFFARYTQSIVEHLSYSLQSLPYVSVEEYIAIRLQTGGMLPVLDLIEYTHSLYLDAQTLQQVPSLTDLRRQCALIGALSNDLFSYAKEQHSDYNLVNAYLRTGEATDYADAVHQSIRRVNALHQSFKETLITARAEIARSSPSSADLGERYVAALEVIIASCYHWQKRTGRYVHEGNVFGDMRG